ncbi:unnamed protein product [Acanthosepion pharaonis]|uniref:Uncharacterized protein n=1 Tax=Acanthosepion pharaonis TaxID=158019 RepID=A0A812E4Q3_ACAPH|nr:unnamed protein product [Sepia pharaonis]
MPFHLFSSRFPSLASILVKQKTLSEISHFRFKSDAYHASFAHFTELSLLLAFYSFSNVFYSLFYFVLFSLRIRHFFWNRPKFYFLCFILFYVCIPFVHFLFSFLFLSQFAFIIHFFLSFSLNLPFNFFRSVFFHSYLICVSHSFHLLLSFFSFLLICHFLSLLFLSFFLHQHSLSFSSFLNLRLSFISMLLSFFPCLLIVFEFILLLLSFFLFSFLFFSILQSFCFSLSSYFSLHIHFIFILMHRRLSQNFSYTPA